MESKQSRNEYLQRIYKVQDYIESNINDSLSIEELANVAGFSKFHFHRIFKGMMDEPLSRYVNRLKLERATQLLTYRPDMTITDIAYYFGFTDSAVFSRTFKNHYGVSPSHYRNHNSKNCKDGSKGSNTICFMFSGSGYNYDKPLFYYATMLMLEHKIDVVHIHYSYDEHLMKQPMEEVTKVMIDDINPVTNEVLKNGQYSNSMFLGKSLGTIPIANDFMKREEYFQSKMILLTPLLTFDSIFDSILHSRHEGLLVIGDKDHQYNARQIDQLEQSNLKVEIVKNANHSLNVGEFETENSMEAIAKVIEKLKEVVRTN